MILLREANRVGDSPIPNWEIAQFRVSPAPDQSPASEVRLP